MPFNCSEGYSSDYCTGGSTINGAGWTNPTKLFNDDTTVADYAQSPATYFPGNTNCWIGYDMVVPRNINKVRIYTWSEGHPNRMLKEFKIEASATGAWGGEEVELLHVSGLLDGDWPNGDWKEFEFANDTAYEYWRIAVYDVTTGGNGARLNECEMLECLDYTTTTTTS